MTRSTLISSSGTNAIPIHFTAKCINGTNTILDVLVQASHRVFLEAAGARAETTIRYAIDAGFPFLASIISTFRRTFTAVSRAGCTVFSEQSLADIVSTAFAAISWAIRAVFRVTTKAIATDISGLARATVFIFNFGHAQIVPGRIATIRVNSTNTLLDGFVIAPRVVVCCTTISVARTAIIRFFGAQIVPLDIAAVRIDSAHTGLDVGIYASGCAVRDTTRAFTVTAVLQAVDAGLTLVADTIATFSRALAAVFRAGRTIFTVQSFAHSIAAALTAIIGT